MKIAALVLLAMALGLMGVCGAAETDPKRVPTGRLVQDRPSKAVLYEEDANDPIGRQFVGSAVWRTDRVPPGQGQAPEVTIRADVEIPGQRISLRWSLRRNQDKGLPASHTLEMMFTLPPDFPHSGIQNIPGVLMKQGESTRGVPLAGLAVKVTANFFLIGLSSVDADMQRNIQLLKERSWFDIPVVYGDGQRAIIAIEKGIPGERAFAEAFASWGGEVAKTSPPPSSPPPPPITTSGTGFFVTDHGQVVTAAHVVDGCVRLAIRYDGATRTARLEQLEKTNDVALLDTDVTPARVAKWRSAVRLGEDVVVYGFPWSGVLATDGNVTTGNITALAGLRDDSRFLQLSAPVQRGNSGGPVLDRSGNVVGIVVSKLDVARIAEQLHDTAQNVNFAVKSGVALRALRSWGTAIAEGQLGAAFSTPDLVDFAKGFTAHVICERPAERPPETAAASPPPNKPPELKQLPPRPDEPPQNRPPEIAGLPPAVAALPAVIALQRNDPQAFGAFSKRFADIAANAPDDQLPSLARSALRTSVKWLLANAPGDVLVEITQAYLAYMKALQSVSPETCVALSDESKGAKLTVNLAKELPDLFAREMAVLERVASTDPRAAIAPPSAGQARGYLDLVYSLLSKQPVQTELLGRGTLAPSELLPYCNLVIAFYEAVLALPQGDRINLLRYLYSTAAGDQPVAASPPPNKPPDPSPHFAPLAPAPSLPWPENARPFRTVQDLHLRTQPDPNAPDAILDPAPNDVMPKGAVVRVSVKGCTIKIGSGSGPQRAPINIWCPLSYGNYDGWANAYYLATDDGARLACMVNAAAQGCGSTKYAEGPSFDCAKSAAPDEVTICNSDTLSFLDRQMADLFARVRDVFGSAQQLRVGEEQRGWLGRRAACQKDERCIDDAYRSRIGHRLAEVTPGERGITAPSKPPELKPSERWAVIASRAELQDAISIAQDYKSDYPGTLVVQSQNGQFAVIIGPIDVQQNPSFLTQLTDSNKIPKDTYYSAGTRFVAVVWPGPSAPVQKPFTLRDLLPTEK